MRRLFIITDCADAAVSEIRLGIINNLPFNARIEIEPHVLVQPFSILNAAFLTRLIAELAPINSILYVVVSPLREERPRICGFTSNKNLFFLGRDTGAFCWLTRDFECKALFHLQQQEYVPFGGKNVYPKAIGQFIAGLQPDAFGEEVAIEKLQKLNILDGTVVHIDNFGLIKMFSSKDIFEQCQLQGGDQVQVSLNGSEVVIAIYEPRVSNAEDGTWIVYSGSSLGGLPELALVRGNAAQSLGVKIGDIIGFKKIK